MDAQLAEPPAFAGPDRSALDWLNFFIADVQTGFGPFVAVYLTQQKWTQAEIGVALTIGTITSLVAQVPAGALVDAVRAKRTAAAAGVLAVTFSALLLALAPGKFPVALAEILHGIASCVIGPAVAALSLRIAGYAGMGERLGRNARFAAIGNGLAAAVMGFVGTRLGSEYVFFLTAALGAPALLMLSRIHPLPRRRPRPRRPPVRHCRHPRVGGRQAARRVRRVRAAVPSVQRRDAAARRRPGHQGCRGGREPHHRRLRGRPADRGRRTLAARRPARPVARPPLRAAGGLADVAGPRRDDGAAAGGRAAAGGAGDRRYRRRRLRRDAALIAADITARSGRLTLAMGLAGLPIYIGAALSTTLAGFVATDFGERAAFLALGAVGAAGAALVWLAMPETRQDAAVPVVRATARAETGGVA